ncbi:alpha/beta fold hydrolase [Streptomyces sp. NPDC003077]|uniref:alpha/beta fold hydrolase n=1 Tax=Streptomyces sp. NPDC003077 TaxID=3154443 RepID=UPI0033B0E144
MSDVSSTITPPPSAGYARVGALEMYYQTYGEGRPLVLLHGGLLTIESFGGLIPALAARRQVIAVELQGHGRTADIDRTPSPEHFADDVAALLDHLGIARADVFGYSLGGLVALQLAIARPERVDRLVLGSTHYRHDGYHAEIFDARTPPGSRRMPTEQDFQDMHDAYVRVAPDPGHFQVFADKLSSVVGTFEGWPAEALAAVTAPTLLLVGDTDFVRLEHAAEMHGLIPDARLGVLPATTHMELLRRTDLLLPMLEAFLDPAAVRGAEA